jgi:DNA-binding NarL/FixJ family response regulator
MSSRAHNNDPSDGEGPTSSRVNAVAPRDYRMTRQLATDELRQVFDLYRLGKSTYQLAHQFGTNRHTITSHLQRGGVLLPIAARSLRRTQQP